MLNNEQNDSNLFSHPFAFQKALALLTPVIE